MNDENEPNTKENPIKNNTSSSASQSTNTSSSNSSLEQNNAVSKKSKLKKRRHRHAAAAAAKKPVCNDNVETIYPLYLTSVNNTDNTGNCLDLNILKAEIKEMFRKDYKLKKTICGIIAIFTDNEDVDRFLKIDLAKLFKMPIQVATLNSSQVRYRHNVTIKDLPWCISKLEIENALRRQSITFGEITRERNQVTVEVLNACHVRRLYQEGLNFYDCASFFPIFVDTSQERPDNWIEVVQCYKCQGFGHTSTYCRNEMRCVRCGGPHNLEDCTTPKCSPICCNCGGGHHAAYKMCPVLQHMQKSMRVAFSLTKGPEE